MFSQILIENPQFKLKVGTVNKKNPQSIYIEGDTYISPLVDKKIYDDDIVKMEKSFKDMARGFSETLGIFDKHIISIFDIAQTRIGFGKKSKLGFQIYYKQIGKEPFDKISNLIGDNLSTMINQFANEITSCNFAIFKNK